MSSVKSQLNNILNDLKVCSKETPSELLTRLIDERLKKSLESYYYDLSSEGYGYGMKANWLATDLRRLIK